MRRKIWMLLVLISSFRLFAADSPADAPSPQEVAKRVITAFQTGRAGQLKSTLPTDISILEKGARDFPRDPLIHFALATCYMGQDNTAAAIANMEIAYTNSNKDAGIGIMYALALKMNKQPLKAYALDKELVALHPGVPQLQISLATLDITIQKYDEAIAILESLQQKSPVNLMGQDKSILLLMLGTCYLYQGRHEQAIEALEKAQTLMPDMAAVSMVLGEAYLKNGDPDKAGQVLDKALAINPKIPAVLFHKGIYYEKKGDMEMGQKSFQSAYVYGKQRLKDNGEDYYLMFLICQKLARNEEGEKYRSEAEKLLFTRAAPWNQKK